MNQDITIMCENCDQEFVWSAGEQEFYATRGFSAPKRCADCRAARKKEIAESRNKEIVQTRHQAKCDDCGKDTTVPFKPTPGKPVFCKNCFDDRKKKGYRRG